MSYDTADQAWCGENCIGDGELGIERVKHVHGCSLGPTVTNFYEHCGVEWEDEWTCEVDDECPECGADISPYESHWEDDDE